MLEWPGEQRSGFGCGWSGTIGFNEDGERIFLRILGAPALCEDRHGIFPSKKSMKIRPVIVAGFEFVEFCLPQAVGVSLLGLVFLFATPARAAERQSLQS